jgi:hypothetical protein
MRSWKLVWRLPAQIENDQHLRFNGRARSCERTSKARKAALEKARDSPLLAVEVYNKPGVKFRSVGFTRLMMIAWTSLLQAIEHSPRNKKSGSL